MNDNERLTMNDQQTLIPSAALIGEVCAPILDGHDDTLRVERMTEGVSTWVYRVTRRNDMFYVRVLPEEGASFAPEAWVHRTLLARGARVPGLVHWEHLHPRLGRSLMVTTAIQGRPVVPNVEARGARDVLWAAGRDLAIANGLSVDGWGWVVREPDVEGLSAPFRSARAWLESEREVHLALLRKHDVFSSAVLADIYAVTAAYQHMFDDDQPCLAHGDFDPSHIFAHDGAYTGIIDWGELRGAQPFYDLGHFAMENTPLLPLVLAGYAETTPLPPDIRQRIHLTSLLIAVERLGGGVLKRPEHTPHAPYVAAVHHAVAALCQASSLIIRGLSPSNFDNDGN